MRVATIPPPRGVAQCSCVLPLPLGAGADRRKLGYMYATRRHIRHFWNADDEGISWQGHCRLLVSHHMHVRVLHDVASQADHGYRAARVL